jgi:hypothetical protein
MWSKKWYLKKNISCDIHLLNKLLETDVPWDDAIVVSAGKLRKLWDSLNELRRSVCERRLEMTVRRSALLPVQTAQFTQFFPSDMTSQSKIAQFNWEFVGRFTQFSSTSRRNTFFFFFCARVVTLVSFCCDLTLYTIFLRCCTNSESGPNHCLCFVVLSSKQFFLCSIAKQTYCQIVCYRHIRILKFS